MGKGPHFVGGGGLPETPGRIVSPKELNTAKNDFHNALVAILDTREITEHNISILERNMSIISLQSILDGVERDKRNSDTQSSEKHITKHVNNVKSRIIQTLQELDLGYVLTQMKTITPNTTGDIREVNINSVMIGDLRNKI